MPFKFLLIFESKLLSQRIELHKIFILLSVWICTVRFYEDLTVETNLTIYTKEFMPKIISKYLNLEFENKKINS